MSENVKLFWESYRQAVIASGVPGKNAEWFVRWAQKFADSTKGKPIRERSAADIHKFLLELSIQPGIQPWQIQQAEKALFYLYQDFLKLYLELSSAQTLVPTEEKSTPNTNPRSNFKDRAISQTGENARWGEYIDRLRSALRVRHFSIRTERAYEQWVNSLLSFLKANRSPLEG
jgi:hypothetical protein